VRSEDLPIVEVYQCDNSEPEQIVHDSCNWGRQTGELATIHRLGERNATRNVFPDRCRYRAELRGSCVQSGNLSPAAHGCDIL
jgi:hypothetical protein